MYARVHTCVVAFDSQKRASDPLELESQVVVNCPVGVGS